MEIENAALQYICALQHSLSLDIGCSRPDYLQCSDLLNREREMEIEDAALQHSLSLDIGCSRPDYLQCSDLLNSRTRSPDCVKTRANDSETWQFATRNLVSSGFKNGGSENKETFVMCGDSSTAAVKLQKVYRSYRTRRRLADSAVVAEELWWQAVEFVRLNHSTISFFDDLKQETAASRWSRVGLNASRVGKGLSKDTKAKELAFEHWIEAIDPRHRYGHNLHMYFVLWCHGDAGQPFFYWLDIGAGRDVDIKECPRSLLQKQCIKYLGPKERENYEYILMEGIMMHKQSGELLDTINESNRGKWIFVMCTSSKLYAGQKKKGSFHHSSFLSGGATLAAGRLVAAAGVLKAIWAYSGHYRPTEDNLNRFLSFLASNGVNLEEVQILTSSREDYYDNIKVVEEEDTAEMSNGSDNIQKEMPNEFTSQSEAVKSKVFKTCYERTLSGGLQSPRASLTPKAALERINSKKAINSYQLGHQLSRKWSTGAGPRIGCVADYPFEVRVQALEFVSLSPRTLPTSALIRHLTA